MGGNFGSSVLRESFLEEETLHARQMEKHVQRSCGLLEDLRKATVAGVLEKKGSLAHDMVCEDRRGQNMRGLEGLF